MVLLAGVSGCSVGSSAGSGGTVFSGTSDNGAIADNSISGTVTFEGSPLEGVAVTLFLTNSNAIVQTATTDANGNYRFSGVSATGDVPGEYQFWAEKAGYGFYPIVGSGAQAERADFTGQFAVNGVEDIGIYFTVIDYISLPNGSLSGANFEAYDGSNPRVRLAATGAATSYAAGDDGALGEGVTSGGLRFTDNGNGSVTDAVTGLVWLKDAGCLGAANWAAAVAEANALASGSCGLTDQSKAGDWRLPNLNELASVIDASAAHPAVTAGNPFERVSTGIYWSSTSYFGGQNGSPNAFAIRMDDGRYINDGVLNNKAGATKAVWAVRGTGAGGLAHLAATGYYDETNQQVKGDDGNLQEGVGLSYVRFIDNGNGTLTDTMTGLVWMKAANCLSGSWTEALAAVQTLGNGTCGLSDGSKAGDWRMPNRTEMESLSDRMNGNEADFLNASYVWKSGGTQYRGPVFASFMVSSYYWTSTTDAANPSEAWSVFSCDYGVYDTSKEDTGYTLAVRDRTSTK